MTHRLLIIEDRNDAGLASQPIWELLCRNAAFAYEQVAWGADARKQLRRTTADCIVAVAVGEADRAAELFEWMREGPVPSPTVAVLSPDADPAVVGTVTHAADDFLYAPIRVDELRHRLTRVIGGRGELQGVRERMLREFGLTQLVGKDPAFVRVVDQLPGLARGNFPVFITGETGTGKEVSARALHTLGSRRHHPFIAVDCGALPDHLIENELFGHARGAYTDAHRDQRGLISMAEGGTLFLDEIDALSLTAQAKLLRFLQERSYRPLGGDRFLEADVKIIAATNRDLESSVREKKFRADLSYRLNVLRLHLPPLRERRADVELLAEHFLLDARTAEKLSARSFSPAALRALALHDWPGNVRELANVVHRAAWACDGPQILPCHLTLPQTASAASVDATVSFRAARNAALARFERSYVVDLLRRHSGNVTRAAREAQKERRAFGRILKKHGIDPRAL